jgi:integrase
MSRRRARGDGGIHWDEKRQRWIATLTVGYTPAGKRIVQKRSDRTKDGAKKKLRKLIRDYEDGLASDGRGYAVADAVTDWLTYGLAGRRAGTVNKLTIWANTHVIPDLGARRLGSSDRRVELSADDVDRWLAEKAKILSTSSVQTVLSILRRSITRAQARDKVKRNVALLCDAPIGQPGRNSKALTVDQAAVVLDAAEDTPVHYIGAYVNMSLLTGARTEELRALRWDHVVAYNDATQQWRPVTEIGWEHEKFAIYVWRSVRAGDDTKTKTSRRSVALPRRAIQSLHALYKRRATIGRARPGELVFATRAGKRLSAGNVRRDFRKVISRAARTNPAVALVAEEWTPREMRHSFVSILSDDGTPTDKIARLVGHQGTHVTETVYRLQIRPVILDGAEAMDIIFPDNGGY